MEYIQSRSHIAIFVLITTLIMVVGYALYKMKKLETKLNQTLCEMRMRHQTRSYEEPVTRRPVYKDLENKRVDSQIETDGLTTDSLVTDVPVENAEMDEVIEKELRSIEKNEDVGLIESR